MRLSKLSIRNFRNFRAVDISLLGNVIVLGENRVGKSNLLFAIQLILDPTLPDSARQLKLSDFWDGSPSDYSEPIEVHLELSDSVHRYSRSPDVSSLTLAKRIRRTADRIDPQGMR